MATYWVASDGNNSNDGTTYAQRKLTLEAALNLAEAGGKGNTVNIVGTLNIPDGTGWTGSSMSGTDYDTDFGLRVQGTDSSGAAAMATLTFDDSTTNVTVMNLSTGADYFDIVGIKVNWNHSTSEGSKIFINQSSTGSNGLRIRYCIAECAIQFGGAFLTQVTTSAETELSHNIFIYRGRSSPQGGLIFLDDRGDNYVHHNILVYDGTISVSEFGFHGGNNMADGSQFRVQNNTFYLTSNFVESGTARCLLMTDSTPVSGTPLVRIKDNVYYCEPTKSNMAFTQFQSTNEALWTIDIGYNHFFYKSGNTWLAEAPYEDAFDPNGNSPASNDLWANDSEQAAVPFNDVTDSTFVWDFEGSSYSVTLEWDLRIVAAYRAKSSTGGVPGAVTTAITTPVIVAPATAQIKASIVDAVSVTIPIQNTGDGDLIISAVTLAVVSDADTTLSMTTVTVPWTISAATTEYVTATFRPTQYPYTGTATITLASNDAVTPSAVVNLTGTALPNFASGDNPSIGVDTPAIINSPNLKDGGLSVRLHLRKNLEYEWDFTVAVGGFADTVTNLKVGSVVLATNTALTTVAGLTLAGYNKLMVQPSGGPTLLQAGSSTWLIKDGGCILIANMGSMSTVKMSNPSLFKDITVHIFASGGTVTDADPRGKRDGTNEISVSD